jgi:hypothetical protein
MANRRTAVSFLLLCTAAVVGLAESARAQAGVSVLTWHNDNWRTGQNTNETILNTTNVGSTSTFGLLCRIPLSSISTSRPTYSNQIYGQPLVVGNGNAGSTLYIVTEGDFVYGFTLPLATIWNANSCSNLISNLPHAPVDLLASFPGEYPVDCCYIGVSNCGTIAPTVGVLSTPVIVANTIFLVAESQSGQQVYNPGVPCQEGSSGMPSSWIHRLHALDLTPGSTYLQETNNGPTQISGTYGNVTFNSSKVLQRPGLLYVPPLTPGDPTIDIGFSMMDSTFPQPSGWIFSYHSTNLQIGPPYPKYYATTGAASVPPTTPRGGGIWQGGAGLAVGLDANGARSIFFSTAEGIFDLPNTTGANADSGDSFVKLPTDLPTISTTGGYFTSSNFFAPADWFYRWCNGNNDVDFGSGGVMLVPDQVFGPSSLLAIKGDKEGGIWAIDRTVPNGVNNSCPRTTPCSPCTTVTNDNAQTVFPANAYFHNTPAYWSNGTVSSIYMAGVKNGRHILNLTKFPLNASSYCGSGGPICPSSYWQASTVGFQYGTTPSISSSGTSGGIVWAIDKTDGPAPMSIPCIVTPGSQTCAVLHAFDATTMSELYNSNMCQYTQNGNTTYPDVPGGAATKFSPPTIANGYVIIGTQTEVDIYGANPTRTCTP